MFVYAEPGAPGAQVLAGDDFGISVIERRCRRRTIEMLVSVRRHEQWVIVEALKIQRQSTHDTSCSTETSLILQIPIETLIVVEK
jgi:hypothetical protein